MSIEKKPHKEVIGKAVVTKEGKRLGTVKDITFETRSGELIHIVVKDNHLKHYINGVLMSEVTDEDAKNRKYNGVLGLQVHVMPKMKVEYRNIMLKQL